MINDLGEYTLEAIICAMTGSLYVPEYEQHVMPDNFWHVMDLEVSEIMWRRYELAQAIHDLEYATQH